MKAETVHRVTSDRRTKSTDHRSAQSIKSGVIQGRPAGPGAARPLRVINRNATTTTREFSGNSLRGPSPERNIAVEIGKSGGASPDGAPRNNCRREDDKLDLSTNERIDRLSTLHNATLLRPVGTSYHLIIYSYHHRSDSRFAAKTRLSRFSSLSFSGRGPL